MKLNLGINAIGWSLTNRLVWVQGLIKSRGDIWYSVVWALVLVMNQLIILITGRPVTVAMVLLLTSTGLVMGNSSGILFRFYQMRAQIKEV